MVMIPMVGVVVKKADMMKAVESEVMVVVTSRTAVVAKRADMAVKTKEDTAVKKVGTELELDTIARR